VKRSGGLSFYLREPDLDATLSADGKTLRIYGVNSTPEHRRVRFDLPTSFGSVQGAQVLVVGDSNAVADSEAMNSHDEPHRVSLRSKRLDLSVREFDHDFAPFSVTLLELQLASKK
jgi:alpha-L-arabinofuranosidase